MSKFSNLLVKNKEYRVKGVSYYRTFPLKGIDQYKNALLFINPHEDVRINIISIVSDSEIAIKVEKYNLKNEHVITFYGDISKSDLILLLGIE